MTTYHRPSKTGTTAIQAGSVGLKSFLQQDNTLYTGKFAGRQAKQVTRKLLKCAMEWYQTLNTTITTTNATVPYPAIKECSVLKQDAMQKSLIASDEGYSYKDSPEPLLMIKALHYLLVLAPRQYDLPFLPFSEIIVVGTYRRYADWLRSTFTGHTKANCLWDPRNLPVHKRRMFLWPQLKAIR